MSLMDLTWLPESVTLKTIMELMQTVASFGSGDGLRVVGNSEHMENLLHNLQVLIETQKYDSISPSNCIFLIGSQLNTFVSELHHVYHGTLQGTIDGKRNPNTGEPKNDDLAATLHLIVICAEQVIGFQRFYLERAQRQTDCAKSVRILTVDSIALLYSMLGAIRGSFVNVTASAVEMLMENSHENLLRLRSDASATVSISTSEEDATKDSRFLLAKLPFEFRMPASYRMEYSSTAVTDMKCSIAPFVAIIDSAMTKLVQVVDLLAGVRATGAHTAKKSSSNAAPAQHAVTLQNESAVREDRATLLTQTIIHVARHWNKVAACEESDRLAAHTLIQLLEPRSTADSLDGSNGYILCALQSAGFTAIVPIAMRLLDRYQPGSHTLGLLLLYKAANATPTGLLMTFLDWILPHLFKYLEIVSDDWSRLVASRLLHSLIASGSTTALALQHSHLYLESSIRQLQMKPTVEFAWPYLLHFHAMLSWYPEGTLRLHLTALVDVYLQLLNVWHLPLQIVVLEGIFALTQRLRSALKPYVNKLATELCRVAIFYHSQQRDISGANAECVAIIVANCTTLGAQLRSCSTATWDDYLNEVIGHMNLSLEKEKKEGEGKSHKQKKLSCDGSASAHALLVVSNFQQSVRSFLK